MSPRLVVPPHEYRWPEATVCSAAVQQVAITPKDTAVDLVNGPDLSTRRRLLQTPEGILDASEPRR
jgi:hypothetical protein